jgi:hypothetical protein
MVASFVDELQGVAAVLRQHRFSASPVNTGLPDRWKLRNSSLTQTPDSPEDVVR